MSEKVFFNIFKEGSKTYFYSSAFFPKKVRKEVFILYGFVRTLDNYVDTFPQKKNKFIQFKKDFFNAREGNKINNPIISEFLMLEKAKNFDKKWAESFIDSMEMDLIEKKHITLKDIEKYMYGSAEVIGLFMSKIIGVPKEGYPCARLLGKSMQYINFIRDIDEDICLGRNYFPLADYAKCNISPGDRESMISNKKGFEKFIKLQLNRYNQWQKEAEKGYVYLPKRYRIAIKTASDMYNWTAKTIKKNPTIVFTKKVKPNIIQILGQGAINLIQENEIMKER